MAKRKQEPGITEGFMRCSNCKEILSEDKFIPNRGRQCKACLTLKSTIYNKSHPEVGKKARIKFRENNKDRLNKEYNEKYHNDPVFHTKVLKKKEKYYYSHQEEEKQKSLTYYYEVKDTEEYKQKKAEYRETHLDELNAKNKIYREANREALAEHARLERELFPEKTKDRVNRCTDKKLKEYQEVKNSACEICGNKFLPNVMEFDHIDPENKLATVSELMRKGAFKQAREEMAKCQLLCANCHRIKTFSKTFNIQNEPFRTEFYKYKENNPCVDCGQKYPTYVMDFDHLPQFEKIESVSVMFRKSYSKEEIWAEIKKCELVCVNCHRVRTESRKHS